MSTKKKKTRRNRQENSSFQSNQPLSDSVRESIKSYVAPKNGNINPNSTSRLERNERFWDDVEGFLHAIDDSLAAFEEDVLPSKKTAPNRGPKTAERLKIDDSNHNETFTGTPISSKTAKQLRTAMLKESKATSTSEMITPFASEIIDPIEENSSSDSIFDSIDRSNPYISRSSSSLSHSQAFLQKNRKTIESDVETTPNMQVDMDLMMRKVTAVRQNTTAARVFIQNLATQHFIKGTILSHSDGHILHVAGEIEADTIAASVAMIDEELRDLLQSLGLGSLQNWALGGKNTILYANKTIDFFLIAVGKSTKRPELMLEKAFMKWKRK